MPEAPEAIFRIRVCWGIAEFADEHATDMTASFVNVNGASGARPSANSVAPALTLMNGRLSLDRAVADRTIDPLRDTDGQVIMDLDGEDLSGIGGVAESDVRAPSAFRLEANLVPTVGRLAPGDYDDDGGPLLDTDGQPLLDTDDLPITEPREPWYVVMEGLIESSRATRYRRHFTLRSRRHFAYSLGVTYLRTPRLGTGTGTVGAEIAYIADQMDVDLADDARGVPGSQVGDPMRRGWIIHSGDFAGALEKMAQFAIGVAAETHRGDLAWWHRRPATGGNSGLLFTGNHSNAIYQPLFPLIDEQDGLLHDGVGVVDLEQIDDGMGIDNHVECGANTGQLPPVQTANTLGTLEVQFDPPGALVQYNTLLREARARFRRSQDNFNVSGFARTSQFVRLDAFLSLYGMRVAGVVDRMGLFPGQASPNYVFIGGSVDAEPIPRGDPGFRATPLSLPTPGTTSRFRTLDITVPEEIVVPAAFDRVRDQTVDARVFQAGQYGNDGTIWDFVDSDIGATSGFRVPATYEIGRTARLDSQANITSVRYETYRTNTRLEPNVLRVTVSLSQSGVLWGLLDHNHLPRPWPAPVGTRGENIIATVTIRPKGGAGDIPKEVLSGVWPAANHVGPFATAARESQDALGLLPLSPPNWLDSETALYDREAMLRGALARKRVLRGKVWMVGDTESVPGETETARANRARNEVLPRAVALQVGMCVSVRSDRFNIPTTPFMVMFVDHHVSTAGVPYKEVILHEV